MSELFDTAKEYALNGDIVMGGRMATRFTDEGQFRLQSQALKVLSMARILAREDGVEEENAGFQAKVIAHVKAMENRYGKWDQGDDGNYYKTFDSPEELNNTLIFMRSLGVLWYQTGKDKSELSDSLRLQMSPQDYDMVFTPSAHVVDPDQDRRIM